MNCELTRNTIHKAASSTYVCSVEYQVKVAGGLVVPVTTHSRVRVPPARTATRPGARISVRPATRCKH